LSIGGYTSAPGSSVRNARCDASIFYTFTVLINAGTVAMAVYAIAGTVAMAVYAGDRISDKKKKKRALRSIYNRCGGRDTDHPGVIIRPRNMKLFYFHRLRREAQARERDLYFDEDRQR